MGFTPNARRAACLATVPLIISAWIVGATLHAGRAVHADQTTAADRTIRLGAARVGDTYAVTISVKNPAQIQGTDAVHVTVKDATGEVESKWLHAADLDFYLTLRPRAPGPVTVNLSAAASAHVPEISATMVRLPAAAPAAAGKTTMHRGVIAAAPNGTWQTAQPFEVGQTIFGSDDERPYAPSKTKTVTPPW